MDNVSQAQSDAVRKKANNWEGYLKTLSNELNSTLEYYFLREASLWASTFAYIEWLIVFHLYKTFPTKNEIANTLKEFWGWDKEIGEVFWTAGRHPIAHIGQANFFHSYLNFRDLPANVSFNSSTRWTKAVTGDWGKYNPFEGVTIYPPLVSDNEVVQIITFFHQMILSELLPKLANGVISQIENESKSENLQKILELNKQIPH
ncbi:MAG: hypothetical protein A2172_04500 [Candidatus Woykebacteria bacterium RBG_13_40_15]|uniref:Uncharacterized protein n=1 Tax=Candidatus Woykebacteria bacterium RBG_13_40_15 TaxID=1802593 RepID=A0A1G1W766_9BACT|nr:MAG: hypothetical protein A2172_04500 [Candidatus Woykebacteria bacterium RBG_13_40_15]